MPTSARQNAVFYGNLQRIRNIFRADRVVGPYSEFFNPPCFVGADDSVRPQNAPVFTGIYGESVTSQRADVGIGPYWIAAQFLRGALASCGIRQGQTWGRRAAQMETLKRVYSFLVSRFLL